MVSQLLFGETVSIIDKHDGWAKVIITFDEYEGWIHSSQLVSLSLPEFLETQKAKNYLSFDLVQILLSHQRIYSIVLGSTLPWFREGLCRIGDTNYTFDGNARIPDYAAGTRMIVENAFMYLNAPYLWGGRSPFGIDCSGFTQMVYKLCGITLKRDAWMQAEQGSGINLLDETQPGDLVFFDNEEGKIIHTGILTAKNRVIHASGQVRVDNIDHHGIFNTESRKYTHKLRLIKRII
jgi:hypothetical protein